MKKHILYTFLILALTLSSCGLFKNDPCPEVNTVHTEKTVVIETIVKDSIVKIEGEKSTGLFVIHADTNGNIELKPILSNQGKTLNAPKASIKGNVLTVDCETRAQEIFLQWKEQHIKENNVKETVKTITKEIVLPLTKWQQFLQLSGFGFWIALLVLIIYRVYQKFSFIK